MQLQARERPVPGFDTLVAGSLAVDRLLEDGDVIDLGCGLKLQVFHTPGHSRGSISLLLLGYQALFSGDAIPVPGELPVYEDVRASVASVKNLKAIKDVRHLLPSWDEPLQDSAVCRRLEEGLQSLQRIHDAVRACAGTSAAPDLQETTRCVLRGISLPPELANPLVARSIAAHLEACDCLNIIQ